MTDQPTFADLEYQHKKRQTRREVFLKRIDTLIPWQRLEERIQSHYFKAERGRRPYPLSGCFGSTSSSSATTPAFARAGSE